MTITITVSGQSYNYAANDAHVAGLGAARSASMATLSPGEGQTAETPIADRPGYIADDVAYLQWAIEKSGRTDVLQCMADALNSYAGIVPDPVVVEAVPLSPKAQKAALLAYAADKRYRVETAGCIVSGVHMPTDRDTQAKMTAAFLLSQVNSNATFSWKTPAGFVTLTAAQIGGIAVAIGQFVQSAYATEAVVSSAINDGTITTTSQIDAANWPA